MLAFAKQKARHGQVPGAAALGLYQVLCSVMELSRQLESALPAAAASVPRRGCSGGLGLSRKLLSGGAHPQIPFETFHAHCHGTANERPQMLAVCVRVVSLQVFLKLV